MGFSRKDYWSGLLCPPPGDLPNPGIKPASPALADGFFITSTPWEAVCVCVCVCYKTETGKLAQRPHMQIGYVIILSKQLRPQSAKLASLVTQMVKNLPAMRET